MQVFKRLVCHCETKNIGLHVGCPPKQSSCKNIKNSAQNVIEFVFIFPLLIMLILVILEVALFWQDVNSIYNLNAEINANVADLSYSPVASGSAYTGLKIGDTCPAAATALTILQQKGSSISLNNPTFTKEILYGTEPFALYHYYGGANITASNGEQSRQVQLWVDCRNPFENGIMTQLEFFHKNLILKATIPRFDSSTGIVVIPEYVFIASPKLNTIRHY